jgi:hypothetical protein
MSRGQQQCGQYVGPNEQFHFQHPRVCLAARSLLIGSAAEVKQATLLPYFTGMKHMLENGERP